MGRADEHAPLLTRGRGSRLDNRLALWGDNSNVKRAGFIATLALLGLVALGEQRVEQHLAARAELALL